MADAVIDLDGMAISSGRPPPEGVAVSVAGVEGEAGPFVG
jgi:hypothetical protein